MYAAVSGSPEFDYFRGAMFRQASRWKEDWEELELLVSIQNFDPETS